MSYLYGRDWHPYLLKPIAELTEARARKKFETGPQLSVSSGEPGAVPAYTLILGPAGTHVRIDRYDAHGSVVESYDYSRVDGDDRLFLDNYKTWVYPDQAAGPQTYADCVAHKAWVFRPDGTGTCRETVKPLPEARVTQYRDLDVSGHWRERPTWGDWDRFGLHPEPGGQQIG